MARDHTTKQDSIVHLTRAEAEVAKGLAHELTRCFSSTDDIAFLDRLSEHARDLPPRIRQILTDFRLAEGPCLILRGHVVDQATLGPTPPDWRGKVGPDSAFAEEVLVLLHAAILGDPFAWRTQQDGHIVHDVFPTKDDQHEQLGTGSLEPLTWHTEDAFHPCRADYLLLIALRNDARVATTVGVLDPAWLDDGVLGVLFQPRFLIRPDNSHLVENNTTTADALAAFENIGRMAADPTPVPVLEGPRSAPYLRLDPYFMETLAGDEEARRALDCVTSAIEENLLDIVLEEGDILVLNNRRAVHGRRSFVARFDGTDRWLKRVNVTCDFEKSRAWRASATSRQIG